MNTLSNAKKQSAFTIVELLVVIVVIGILAGITIVSYTGISNRAIITTLQSDLSNASTQFKIFQIDNGIYPSSISTNCATTPTTATNLCLRPSPGNSYTTIAYKNPTPKSFVLTEVNGNNTYHITENSAATTGVWIDPDWITIGTQVWAKANLNVGNMISSSVSQTNNGGTNIIEKYCYNNLESNCIAYGALYQWNEAMQYVMTPGVRGVCLAGSHIPTDVEWQTLEVYLGMTPGSGVGQVNTTGWRGTDQGTKLKLGGSSGLDIILAGYANGSDATFNSLSTYAYLWSSSEPGAGAWFRSLNTTQTNVDRRANAMVYGYSVRCLGN